MEDINMQNITPKKLRDVDKGAERRITLKWFL
jgi:hypothetical protein